MKQLRTQQHSHHNSKAWTSLDCLVISPSTNISNHSSLNMRSNIHLPTRDSRRLSPQTTTSSGYHSDLSSATSTNESPQSIHEILPINYEKSCSSTHLQKRTIIVASNSTYEKAPTNKNISRISSFIRKQYERAKSILSSKTSSPQPSVTKCSKATSTTPVPNSSEINCTLTRNQHKNSSCNENSTFQKRYLTSVYKQSSCAEPVYSVYVHPLHHKQFKVSSMNQQKNYASIHECYSHQPSYNYSAMKSSQPSVSSYRRLAAMANFQNNNPNIHRQHCYPMDALSLSSCQNYIPYQYTNNNYEYHQSNYVPLSDFLSTQTSAFKPIAQKRKELYQRPSYNTYEQISISDDPCDLEVAQYFPHTSQWSNPNYFDIYSKDINSSKQTYTETLC